MVPRRVRSVPWPAQKGGVSVSLDASLISKSDGRASSPSVWAAMTKSEKSLYPVIEYFNTINNTTPGDVLLAGISGIYTRKAVRKAIERLNERNIVKLSKGYRKEILINTKKQTINLNSWIFESGQWAVTGMNCPSSHALFIAMVGLLKERPVVEYKYIDEFEEVGLHTHTEFMNNLMHEEKTYVSCEETKKVLADHAGISRKTFPVALHWLLEAELIKEYPGPVGGYVIPWRVNYCYNIEWLMSARVE